MAVQIPVIVVFGPTAVGKTDFLLHFEKSCEIINLDSLQVYRHMSVGTAKPGSDITSRIPHHLIDCVDPDCEFSAGDFVTAADRLCREIHARGKTPVISGGTGFFLKNFIYGLPKAPPSVESIRTELQSRLEREGLPAMRALLEQVDNVSWRRIAVGDSYRIMRALEVYYSSGRPLSDFQLPDTRRSEYRFFLIGLIRDRAELYSRINDRVDMMFRNGLVEEYKKLRAMGYSPDAPGLGAIGYKEFSLMESLGSMTLSDVRELIKQNSRNYAKRQITYFKALDDVLWIHPDSFDLIIDKLAEFV
ncbi:MAG: tRNA (adenosine(37)-N6)-dimethylallyltransferase MiaA [Spirochaetia bacterium]|nr:tRNA (adenosine(37)-N6)-dimethylallyltransferase MiaA [Spirochaetia bacterium]